MNKMLVLVNNFQPFDKLDRRIKLRLAEVRLHESGAYSPDKDELLSQKRNVSKYQNTLSNP